MRYIIRTVPIKAMSQGQLVIRTVDMPEGALPLAHVGDHWFTYLEPIDPQ